MNRRPIQVRAAATAATVVVAVALGTGAAVAQTRAGAASAKLPASLSGLVCHHALHPANRSVAATAVTHAITGATRVAVDFHLFRRAPGTAFTAVHGPGLNAWMTKQLAQPSDAWRVIHTVSDLSAPAGYRFVVGFRWLGAGGQILDHTRRSGHICHQPELRPNLQVKRIQVAADTANAQDDIYRAQIHDAGVTGAGPFQVQLSDAGVVQTRRVTHIDARGSLWVRLVGALCNSAQPPVVTVDPHHRIDVSSRAEGSLSATCPAPASGASGA